MKTNDKDIAINFYSKEVFYVDSDFEQLNRVFINLFKNSIESLKEKHEKIGDFQKKINIEIRLINDYINIEVLDNGTGFTNNDPSVFSKPYFTTKKEGSGLGLSIVEKILNDHNGFIEFVSQKEGAKIKILLPKYVD
jgi:two-component system nitrogen regulation sensor histidine kinase NtrY